MSFHIKAVDLNQYGFYIIDTSVMKELNFNSFKFTIQIPIMMCYTIKCISPFCGVGV